MQIIFVDQSEQLARIIESRIIDAIGYGQRSAQNENIQPVLLRHSHTDENALRLLDLNNEIGLVLIEMNLANAFDKDSTFVESLALRYCLAQIPAIPVLLTAGDPQVITKLHQLNIPFIDKTSNQGIIPAISQFMSTGSPFEEDNDRAKLDAHMATLKGKLSVLFPPVAEVAVPAPAPATQEALAPASEASVAAAEVTQRSKAKRIKNFAYKIGKWLRFGHGSNS